MTFDIILCLLIDLFNREIIGYSFETNKTVQLVQRNLLFNYKIIKTNYVISYWLGAMNLKIK
ncbi:hypothetical protein [Spiroplasma endosymbiont of Polydrusus formosus]|uniref:hypothetical protein n=1 Tax=Spiroplasma endosymbiont of Polydrusus formosus TaxID=3139326 RepID=UPI0035B55AC4